MLTLGDLAADGVAVIDLAAIGAEIEPAGIGVLRHHAVGGADEARLVELMVARHRKFQNIDFVALDHVLQDRTVVDETRRQRLQVLHAAVILLYDIDLAFELERQPQGQCNAAHRRELPVERAEALGIAGHVVEQDRGRRAAALLREHVGERAHLDVPMGAVDPAQLAQPVDLFEPAAQPAIVHARLRCGFGTDAGHADLRGNSGGGVAPPDRLYTTVYSRTETVEDLMLRRRHACVPPSRSMSSPTGTKTHMLPAIRYSL